jgi:hypothetical protein
VFFLKWRAWKYLMSAVRCDRVADVLASGIVGEDGIYRSGFEASLSGRQAFAKKSKWQMPRKPFGSM